ncbi:hypothetical protein PAMA_010068 [Pampus argenteus]
MGSGCSQHSVGYDYNYAIGLYETALRSTCVLPDVGIDESLLKYSGVNSNAALQAYSNELVNSVPGLIEKLGSSLGSFTSIPNAVGLGALVISMIMEICLMTSAQQREDSYSMLRRVFGEEKASGVRDTMSEYLKRHHVFINNDQRLREEIRRLEVQLSGHLTILRNSLLHDGQMSSRGFKIWVNGASFHILMLIHEARLNVRAGKRASDYVGSVRTVISLYMWDLESLLEKYKTYKISTTELRPKQFILCGGWNCASKPINCYIKDTEKHNCEIYHEQWPDKPCNGCDMKEFYIYHMFSKYKPISSLRSHFSNFKNNINSVINQHDDFTLPTSHHSF